MAVAGYVSWASSSGARRVMQGNRKRDTRPELALRRTLHRQGLRYRVATRPLSGRPWTADLVFAGPQVAVFVDGCYWHGCSDHYAAPRTNAAYWTSKIARNRARDDIVDAELGEGGWTVIRIWEHESAADAAEKIAGAIRLARRRAE